MSVKPREQRRKVMISARMQAGARWQDACILDISSNGMLVHAADPPMRGSYLEIRRGAYVIVARVVWTDAQRCGVRSQDRIPVESLIKNIDPPVAQRRTDDDRRVMRSHVEKAGRSRSRGRTMEFAAVVSIAFGFAGGGLLIVKEALTQPLASVRAALSGSR